MNHLPNDVSNIPLHCNVCPKRPDFSDVSHLLTHVASKGHLSAYYKMKVKCSTDDDAKKIVDDYDEWYEDWNLDELMRERMSQKEKKRGSAGTNTSRRGSGTKPNSARSTPSAQARGSRSTRTRGSNMSLLDPQLGHRLKAEPMSRSDTPMSAYSMDATTNLHLHRPMPPPMQNWAFNTSEFNNSPLIKQESIKSEPSDDDDDYEYEPRRSNYSRRYKPSSTPPLPEDLSQDDLANDNTKLKGIYWPGMSLFDSATPDMRRKRNQKKDSCVLESLQATSEVVEPTECVFDTDGVLRKEREITGVPDSDDSLIEGESEPEPELPKQKRPRRRPRPALVKKEVNTGRITRGRSHHPGRKIKVEYTKEEDDDDLTYRAPRPRKRTGLSIHRDNTGPEITFDQPAPMNYLTAGFRNPFQSNVMQTNQSFQNNGVPRSHSRQPSYNQFNGGFRPNNASSGQSYASNFGHFYNPAVAQPPVTGNHAHGLAGFQQQLGMGPQAAHTPNPLFQPNSATWDFLGLDNHDLNMDNLVETAFPSNGQMHIANPLFFGNTKEDDEATISAPEDDR